ncbi:hypothetical protein BDZ90DRAFT_233451 [Jaminaea rosea]|uniref:Uncharacterized protein n=1 Tax=Jaminaea rosea TaxID=1569628 RepID=A0A316UT89_9BASI|nr:hypothetical protein BDZ90DRAFT_233451 [Jaminaea rosea]PWN26315.1 hypothetical protein BDZ90DRAFT_233451 [Jaminaea rosea]
MVASLVARSFTRSATMTASRGFATSAVAGRDLVQEAYLRELKAYKPPAKSADAHKGQVRDFHAPSPPKAPEAPSSSSLSSQLEAYASSEPDHADAPAASSSSESSSAAAGGSAFLEEARADYPKEEAHH